MYRIRNLHISDREEVRDVCLVTASGVTTEKQKKILWYLFCDYYVDNARDTSFVVEAENGKVIGYLFCAPDYREYEKKYRKHILKHLYRVSFKEGFTKSLSLAGERLLAKKYPAHLHIDIKQEGQRMGLGHQMMDKLLASLHDRHVPAVYLIVGADNKKGRGFYEKYGFTQIRKVFDGIQYAIDVEKKYEHLLKEGRIGGG